ncbi:replication factor C subunit 4-like [Dysidea avara]|uniref:replication factor C subunit 4-like n=1 Tax=Dysidea avara TaxID=196820 RepID=UPI00332629EA
MDSFLKPQKTKNTTVEKRKIPWVEKYRPASVEDVVQQDEVVAVLKKTITGSDLPNLLFYGPPGTGKTSTILAAGRHLFGAELMRSRVLELNASDERGIDVIRERVKQFSQLTAAAVPKENGSLCPPYKIVILDEADFMTTSAQAALRRTMEKQSKTTRFCLICNYISRIIEPLTSRCSKFRFKPLTSEVVERRLQYISEQEKLTCHTEAMGVLLRVSEGDLRRAITLLQSASQLKSDEEITKEDFYNLAGVLPDEKIQGLFKACFSNSYESLDSTVQDILADGYSASQIITQVFDHLVNQAGINDQQKSEVAERLALVDKRLIDGGDEYLQLMDMCTLMMEQFCSQ